MIVLRKKLNLEIEKVLSLAITWISNTIRKTSVCFLDLGCTMHSVGTYICRPSREELVKRNILVASVPSTPTSRIRQSSSSVSVKPLPPIPPGTFYSNSWLKLSIAVTPPTNRASADEEEEQEEKETIFPLETKVFPPFFNSKVPVTSGEISCLPGEEVISKIDNVLLRGKSTKLFLTNFQLHFVQDTKNVPSDSPILILDFLCTCNDGTLC